MRHYLLALFFLITSSINSQNSGEYPLEIPILLSGTFGELRPNHFHAGIDIKTQGVEGKRIYASADGFISRVKIQHGGYGKVIYIDHPNGYTTVYAHLKSFSPKIDSFVKKKQYENESFTLDWYPESNQILVNRTNQFQKN